MEISTRGLWTLVHGMGFGALYLLLCSGALLELYRFASSNTDTNLSASRERFIRIYLVIMVALAWFAVLTGTYIVYPWYRAVPPATVADLSMFPQRLLMANVHTAGWHHIGMEWKEHVAWFTPISITMATAVFFRYGASLRLYRWLRLAVLSFVFVSFMAAGVAGFLGAMLDKVAPVQGGKIITVQGGDQ